MKETPKLEKWQTALKVIAAVAPLLGLLGTVVGMIQTFQSITLFGTGDPKLMSGGISQALITTAAGLSVAIPSLMGYRYLRGRVDTLVVQMEQAAMKLLETLHGGERRTQERNK